MKDSFEAYELGKEHALKDKQRMTQVSQDPNKPIDNPNVLVGMLAIKQRATLNDDGPPASTVLEWLATQDRTVIRLAIRQTQPKGWATAMQPLEETLSDEQVVGFLAALTAVFVQAIPA